MFPPTFLLVQLFRRSKKRITRKDLLVKAIQQVNGLHKNEK